MAAERCDRCGGKATRRYVRGAQTLVLCGQHVKVHGEALKAGRWNAYRLVDVPA